MTLYLSDTVIKTYFAGYQRDILWTAWTTGHPYCVPRTKKEQARRPWLEHISWWSVVATGTTIMYMQPSLHGPWTARHIYTTWLRIAFIGVQSGLIHQYKAIAVNPSLVLTLRNILGHQTSAKHATSSLEFVEDLLIRVDRYQEELLLVTTDELVHMQKAIQAITSSTPDNLTTQEGFVTQDDFVTQDNLTPQGEQL